MCALCRGCVSNPLILDLVLYQDTATTQYSAGELSWFSVASLCVTQYELNAFIFVLVFPVQEY